MTHLSDAQPYTPPLTGNGGVRRPNKQQFFHSLGAKTSLIIIVLLGLLLAAIILIIRTNINYLVSEIGVERARQEAHTVQAQLHEAEQHILREASLLATTDGLAHTIQRRDTTDLTALLASANFLGDFSAITLYDKTGRHLAERHAEPAAAEAHQQWSGEDNLLAVALQGMPQIRLIAGEAQAEHSNHASQATPPGQSSAPEHHDADEKHHAAPEQPLHLMAAVPIYEPYSQTIVGALVASRTPDASFLASLILAQNDVVISLIYDGSILREVRGNLHTPDAEHDHDQHANSMSELLNAAALQQALAGDIAISNQIIHEHGSPHALVHVPFAIQNNTEAVLGILVGLEHMTGFQHQIENTTTIAVVFLMFVGMTGMWLFIRTSVTSPLQRLKVAAEHIASGQHQHRVGISSLDEIGQLGQAFNTMAHNLQDLYATLETKVATRTAEFHLALKQAEAAHALATQREQERLALQNQLIEAQRAAIRELSTPLIPISDHIVVMPIIGTIDSGRAQQIMETLLEGIARHHSDVAILDITGVQVVDTQVANALIRAAQAVKLLGARVILTGIRPQIAQTLVQLGVDLRGITTHSTLQAGIAAALT